MPKLMFQSLTAVIGVLLFTQAHAIEPMVLVQDSVRLNSCITYDTSMTPHPNSKDPDCKVLLNKPGSNQDLLSVQTNVNIGTLENPIYRPTRIDVTVTKSNGKLNSLQQKVTNLQNSQSDTFDYQFSPDHRLSGGTITQAQTKFGVLTAQACAPLRPFVAAFGAQTVQQCANLLSNAQQPLQTMVASMAKDKVRLGAGTPDLSQPSLMKMSALDPGKMKDIFVALMACSAQLASPTGPTPALSPLGGDAVTK